MILLIEIIANKETRVNTKVKRNILVSDMCSVVFNVPSTTRSFRDGAPIYCPLRRT